VGEGDFDHTERFPFLLSPSNSGENHLVPNMNTQNASTAVFSTLVYSPNSIFTFQFDHLSPSIFQSVYRPNHSQMPHQIKHLDELSNQPSISLFAPPADHCSQRKNIAPNLT
jgi:hypothetical protein